ncbi:hypothetical protein [Micromonospora haikouensis]|uniref:hypothetical protein n=1 Tax=Micromonospora haikouensis TaxID=686309 RepID=UPI003D712399
MAATANSARVFLAVDPPQEWEESLTILGAYGSLAAAQYAVRQHRTRPPYVLETWRTTQVQEWVGDELRTTWTYSPHAGWKTEG